MVRHLVPDSDEIIVLACGRTHHLQFGLAHEGVVELQTGEEIADTHGTEDIMSDVEGYLCVEILRLVSPFGKSVPEIELAAVTAPCVSESVVIDSSVGYVGIDALPSHTDTRLDDKSAVLVLVEQMQSGSSASRGVANTGHVVNESRPAAFRRYTDEMV